jgi:DNA-binding GntR family transcriptional regulator
VSARGSLAPRQVSKAVDARARTVSYSSQTNKTSGAGRTVKRRTKSSLESAPDIVYQEILTGLYHGQYAPGQRLIEADISQKCGVSRGPIREAFRRLAAEGVLSLPPNRGAYVRSLTIKEVQNTLVVVEALLRTAARLAAQKIGEGDNRSLFEQTANAFAAKQESGDFRAYIGARAHLTEVMLIIAGNDELSRVMAGINMTLLRAHFIPFGGELERRRHKQYRAIVDAILAGKPAAAERAVTQHVRSVSKDVGRLLPRS